MMRPRNAPDILPCPFDAGAGILVEVEAPVEVGFGFSTYCVCCEVCGAAGPNGGSFEIGKIAAIRKWNRREL
jgi:hypothetical protein